MNDLAERIKEKLPLKDVADPGSSGKREGKYWVLCCPLHNEKTPSFKIDEERGSFKCHGCGASGDVFDYVGRARFGRVRPVGADFVEVLKACADMAGIEWTESNDPSSAAVERRVSARRVGTILSGYAEVAAESWTPELRVRVQQQKKYLTQDVCERWNLGISPTLSALKAAGLSEDDLRFVGLLRKSSYQEGPADYLHFRSRLIIPHMRQGRATYLCGRSLDRACAKEKKYLNLPLPKDGTGGVLKPWWFNNEACWDKDARTKGVLLVEGRLDAIACCENGHPAVAFLSSPSEEFGLELGRYAGVVFYYCPDATKDMTLDKRAEGAALCGLDVRVCELLPGMDPDDLDAAGLDAAKSMASEGGSIGEWLKATA